MPEDKVARFSVSMPEGLLTEVDKVAAEDFAENRSAYLESLAIADLRTRGRLPGNPSAEAHRLLDEAIEARGGAEEIIENLTTLLGAPEPKGRGKRRTAA